MAVKIRLARGGAKKKPYYRIVVANATAPRDGDFLEKVGTYNPLLAKGEGDRVTLKADRITYWLSQGATPTDRVANFIAASGIELPEFVAKKMALHLKTRKPKPSKKEVPVSATPAPAPTPVPAPVEAPAPVAPVVAPVVAPIEIDLTIEAPIEVDLTDEEVSVEIDLTEEEVPAEEAPVAKEVSTAKE